MLLPLLRPHYCSLPRMLLWVSSAAIRVHIVCNTRQFSQCYRCSLGRLYFHCPGQPHVYWKVEMQSGELRVLQTFLDHDFMMQFRPGSSLCIGLLTSCPWRDIFSLCCRPCPRLLSSYCGDALRVPMCVFQCAPQLCPQSGPVRQKWRRSRRGDSAWRIPYSSATHERR